MEGVAEGREWLLRVDYKSTYSFQSSCKGMIGGSEWQRLEGNRSQVEESVQSSSEKPGLAFFRAGTETSSHSAAVIPSTTSE